MGSCDRSDASKTEIDCEATLRELDLFLDDELSDEAHHAIREHLGRCTDCLQAFDFHAELKTVIADKCKTDQMPSGLMDRLKECLVTGELVQGADGVSTDADEASRND